MGNLTVTVTDLLYQDNTLLVFRGVDAAARSFRVRSNRDIIDDVSKGDTVSVDGMIVCDDRYGDQFVVDKFIKWEVPTGPLLKALLMTGQGVGNATVNRLISEFGNEDLVYLLESKDITRLSGVPQVSVPLAEICIRSWHEQTGKTKVFQFFTEHSLGQVNCSRLMRIAHRVFQFYGEQAIAKIEHDPYIIWAFASWKDCEILAKSMGVTSNDPRRLRCAVEETLYQLYNQGHTAISPLTLDAKLMEILGNNSSSCVAIFEANNIDSDHPGRIVVDHEGRWSLPGPRLMERYVEEQLRARIAGDTGVQYVHHDQTSLFDDDKKLSRELLASYKLPSGFSLDESQQNAVACVLEHDITVISGAAGSGKTSVLYAVNDLIQRTGRSVLQIALSGKAAQRLMQATQRHAFTIKGLLSQVQRNPAFLDDYEMPVLHIDEASMVDLHLMYQVLKVFEDRTAKFVMIGDEAQLPPIGPGIIFHHLIKFGDVPSVKLLGNYRQGKGSGVLSVASSLREGVWPKLFPTDVVIIDCDQSDLLEHVEALYCEHVKADDDVYIVPATRQLVAKSNDRLHRYLRRGDQSVEAAQEFKIGDPVIFKKNRPKIGLVNGSIGRVVQRTKDDFAIRTVLSETGKKVQKKIIPDLVVAFAEEGRISLLVDEIKSQGERYLQHAYAITCHQAQGSEFDVVIVPIASTQLLDRSWIYTALTRAKTKVYLVGNIAAAKHAVEVRGNAVDQREVGFYL